jgi:hypothetical protein
MSMSPEGLKRALHKLGLSQTKAGRLLVRDDEKLSHYQTGGRTVRHWIAGETRIPRAAEIIIRLLLSGKITLEDIEKLP